MLRKCLANLLSMIEMILNVVWVGLNMELHLSCINPFHGTDLFLYPLKTSNTSGFLMISGVIEVEYCCLKYLKHIQHNIRYINPHHANGFFLYPLKTSENLWLSDFFREYGKSPVTWSDISYSVVIDDLKPSFSCRVCHGWNSQRLQNVKKTTGEYEKSFYLVLY